jgi:flagellar basal body-associated protein FliL
MASAATRPRGRFVLGQSIWVVIMAVLLVLIAAAVFYVRQG